MARSLVLIGNGKWGQNYVTTIKESFPDVSLTVTNKTYWKACVDVGADGVIIATQPDSHVDIALFALERGIPCMIEKPLALTYADGVRLKPYADKVMVNYIHLFAPEFETLQWSPGDRVSVTSTGPVVRLGQSPRLDYGCHALAMLLHLTGDLDAEIAIGEGEKKLEMLVGDQRYTTGEPILKHAIAKFLHLIDGGKDCRFGVNLSLRILASLS